MRVSGRLIMIDVRFSPFQTSNNGTTDSANNKQQQQQQQHTQSAAVAVQPKPEQKPVECNLCHRKFKNVPALNGHMRLHGGYFKKVSTHFFYYVVVRLVLLFKDTRVRDYCSCGDGFDSFRRTGTPYKSGLSQTKQNKCKNLSVVF